MSGIVGSARFLRHPFGIPRAFVVDTPGRDARVIVQEVNHRFHLPLGFCVKFWGILVAPLEGEILPDYNAGPVGCDIELRRKDMGMDSEEVEVGFTGDLEVAFKPGRFQTIKDTRFYGGFLFIILPLYSFVFFVVH